MIEILLFIFFLPVILWLLGFWYAALSSIFASNEVSHYEHKEQEPYEYKEPERSIMTIEDVMKRRAHRARSGQGVKSSI